MTPQDKQKLKKGLEKEIELIEAELNKFTDKNPAVEGDFQTRFHKSDQSDTLDEKAHSVTDYGEEKAVEQNLESRLKDIRETLKKLDEGTYGTCDKCLSSIDEKRLKVIPVARFCFDCAKKARLI